MADMNLGLEVVLGGGAMVCKVWEFRRAPLRRETIASSWVVRTCCLVI